MIDYKMNLPVSAKYYSSNNILEVDRKLYSETYRLAKYFKIELNYDTIPFNEMGMLNKQFKALLFTEQAYDKVKNIDDPLPYRIYGACLFSELKIGDVTHYRGKLSKHWDELEGRFGDFFIGKPISNDMTSFLEKRGLNHRCISF